MSLNDNTSDMIARIRNAQNAQLSSLSCFYSGLNENVLNILKQEGYIEDYSVLDENKKKFLQITLRYISKDPAIKIIKRVSTPGRRVYTSIKKMKKFNNGLGISIVSTSKGVMSDYDCMKNNLGGEIICSVF